MKKPYYTPSKMSKLDPSTSINLSKSQAFQKSAGRLNGSKEFSISVSQIDANKGEQLNSKSTLTNLSQFHMQPQNTQASLPQTMSNFLEGNSHIIIPQDKAGYAIPKIKLLEQK